MSTEEQPKRVAKAHVITVRLPPSNKKDVEIEGRFTTAGALQPLYNPRSLCRIYETSSLLRPNIEAYEVNVDRAGHRFEPKLKFDAKDVLDRLRQMMVQEANAKGDPSVPSDDEIRARAVIVKEGMALEQGQLEAFFANCAPGIGFEELKARRRADLEVTGNAYWEVLRDEDGEIVAFEHLESVDMRLMAVGRELVDVEIPYWTSPISFERTKRSRRFRRFVQMVMGMETVYFKELGDPRVMSAATGQPYKSEEELKAKEPHARAATEVLHWALYSPGCAPYGVPRWIGATPSVTGARGSEEVNATYFDEKGLPTGVLSITGGTFGEGDVTKLEGFLRERAKGRSNYHKIAIISVPGVEASPMGGQAAAPKVEFQDFSAAIRKDGTFQVYEKNCEQKVGAQFRLPGLFRGDSAELNRATADVAVELTNAQVFGPERQKDDAVFNERILPELGIRYWSVASGPASKEAPTEIVDNACKLVDGSVITPNEARDLVSGALEVQLPETDWGNAPVSKQTAGDTVKQLVELRAQLSQADERAFQARADAARAAEADVVDDLDDPPLPPSIQ